MMENFETRDNIKTRILQHMAREWGFRGKTEIDLANFDPVIDLLVGGCSFELERISHEISNSRNRIFKKLIEILMPDAKVQAQSACAIAHLQPVEPYTTTRLSDQFFTKQLDTKQEIFFAPAAEVILHKGKVEYVAYGDRVMKINERLEKDVFATANFGKSLPSDSFFIAVDLSDEISSLEHLTFFFDWKNEINKNECLDVLPLSQWYVNDKEIKTQVGWSHQNSDEVSKRDESNGIQSILEGSQRHFISIADETIKVPETKTKYPPQFTHVFNSENLENISHKLIWIKVVLPNMMRNHVSDMDCLMNCVPMINRQLHTKQEKLHDDIHILPVEVQNQHFLYIESMTNATGTFYQQRPLKLVDGVDDGIYALRTAGVKRFDSREAKELLSYTLDKVRDEAASIRGLGYATVASDLDELDIVFNRIHKNFHRAKTDLQNTTYLFIRPTQHDPMIFLQYWTSDGTLANHIPQSTLLKCTSSADYDPTSIRLVTTTAAGKDPLTPAECIDAFQEMLLTRGRIVTTQDIKSLCRRAFGAENLDAIRIVKTVIRSSESQTGLLRVMQVQIVRKCDSMRTESEWQRMLNQTEIELANKSAGSFPIKLIFEEVANEG